MPKVAHLVLCIGTGWPMNYFAALGDAIYSRGVQKKSIQKKPIKKTLLEHDLTQQKTGPRARPNKP